MNKASKLNLVSNSISFDLTVVMVGQNIQILVWLDSSRTTHYANRFQVLYFVHRAEQRELDCLQTAQIWKCGPFKLFPVCLFARLPTRVQFDKIEIISLEMKYSGTIGSEQTNK